MENNYLSPLMNGDCSLELRKPEKRSWFGTTSKSPYYISVITPTCPLTWVGEICTHSFGFSLEIIVCGLVCHHSKVFTVRQKPHWVSSTYNGTQKFPGQSTARKGLKRLSRGINKNSSIYSLLTLHHWSLYKTGEDDPNKKDSAMEVAKNILYKWVFVYRPPVEVLSDKWGCLVSKLFPEVFHVHSVHILFTTTYHLQRNGQKKRYNRKMLSAFRCFLTDQPLYLDL